MSEKAKEFFNKWLLDPSTEFTMWSQLMQAYADKCVKDERQRIVDALEKVRLNEPGNFSVMFNKGIVVAIKIVNDQVDKPVTK